MWANFLQDADDLFDPVAGLNDLGVVRSFRMGMVHTREHLVAALRLAQPGGCHDTLCYNFQVGTALLVALLDGMAVYVEKKLAVPPGQQGAVYWARHTTFIDPRFAELRAIQQRTNGYIIRGGITVNTLRNLAKHYLPWLPLSGTSARVADEPWDVRFPLDAAKTTLSGPVLSGLLFPLFNDACDACAAFGRLVGQEVGVIQRL